MRIKNAEMSQLLRCSEDELGDLKSAFKEQLLTTMINGQPAIVLTPTELENAGDYEDQMWSSVASQDETFAKMLSGKRWGSDLPHGFDTMLQKVKKKITMDFSAAIRLRLRKMKEQRGEQDEEEAVVPARAAKSKQAKARKLLDEPWADKAAEPVQNKRRKPTKKLAASDDEEGKGKENAEDAVEIVEAKAEGLQPGRPQKGEEKGVSLTSAPHGKSVAPVARMAPEVSKQALVIDLDSPHSPPADIILPANEKLPGQALPALKQDPRPDQSPDTIKVPIVKNSTVVDLSDTSSSNPSRAITVGMTAKVSEVDTEQPERQNEVQVPQTQIRKAPSQPAQEAKSVAPDLKAMIQELVTVAVSQSEARILAKLEQKVTSMPDIESMKEEIKQEVLQDLMGGMR